VVDEHSGMLDMTVFRPIRAVADSLNPQMLLRGFGSLASVGRSLFERGRVMGPGTEAVASGCLTIDDVIAKMTSLGERFSPTPGPGYGVFCFNRLYLAVTKGVKLAVEQRGYFEQPGAISQLDVMFAGLYFDAVDALEAGERPPYAWQVLFDSDSNVDVLPIQFAVAGMNAHINHDLPIALLEQWEIEGRRPSTQDAAYADYTKINQILKSEEDKQKAQLEPGAVREVEELDHDQLGRIDSRMAMWVVEAARAQAWKTADDLWDLRHVPLAREATLAAVDRIVGVWGAAFLRPI
jgi:Family of unknown function (DUF5995)